MSYKIYKDYYIDENENCIVEYASEDVCEDDDYL